MVVVIIQAFHLKAYPPRFAARSTASMAYMILNWLFSGVYSNALLEKVYLTPAQYSYAQYTTMA